MIAHAGLAISTSSMRSEHDSTCLRLHWSVLESSKHCLQACPQDYMVHSLLFDVIVGLLTRYVSGKFVNWLLHGLGPQHFFEEEAGHPIFMLSTPGYFCGMLDVLLQSANIARY